MKWKTLKGYKGVRFREHETRKHGIKKDRYFSIRYQLKGKQKEEGIGWESEGWTPDKVSLKLGKLKEAHKTGKGPLTLKESREIEEQKRAIKQAEKEKEEKESITFGEFYKSNYLSVLEMNKSIGSIHAEKILFTKWIKPNIAKMPFKDIYPVHIEKIKKVMMDNEKAARSIEYVLSIIRQIWNQAKRDGLTDRDSPTKQVKKPKFDNKRIAFFTHEQADTLLERLKEKSEQIHNMALLSLHTGMRAGEIFKLKWADIDLSEGLILIKDAKGGSRPGFMTGQVKEMFEAIKPEDNHADELIFISATSGKIKQISNTFDKVIAYLEYNKGIKDRRQKLTFHNLRHTFASWQVMDGTPLYTVQKLMGHKTIALTERYSHLAPDTLKIAVTNFEKNIKKERKARNNKIVKIK